MILSLVVVVAVLVLVLVAVVVVVAMAVALRPNKKLCARRMLARNGYVKRIALIDVRES